MEEYQLVTVEEMREMLHDEAYVDISGETELCDGLIGGGFGAEFICWWRPNLLRDHLLVEECMSRDDINWHYTTHAYDYRTIAYIRYLWYNPLVWIPIPEDITKKYFVSGRIAEERFVKRLDPYYHETPKNNPISSLIHTTMLDWFAEKLPKLDWTTKIDIFEEKDLIFDICFWKYLTTDDRPLMTSIWDGGKFDLSLVQLFSPSIFLENMKTIAHRQGKTRAAEIVRLFRKDWQRIVGMKFFDVDKVSKEQIEDFRSCLFEGMDYYLEQWEAEQPKQPKPKKEQRPTPKSITFKMGNITDGHLQMLRLKLIDAGWIARDTQPDDFTKLFTGKLNSTQITWTGNVGKGMLVFLFSKMAEQGYIVVPTNHSITTILENHFIDADGNNLSGLNSSKESTKHLPIVKECLDILQLEADAD